LPESGAEIRGQRRSCAELLEASGYSSRPNDFDELIRILDREVRLIMPADPEADKDTRRQGDKESPEPSDTVGASAASVSLSPCLPVSLSRSYQLTHDYLVPVLRAWLTRRQKETWRGRAELRLAERAALWNTRPHNSHLPAWWEWANIRLLTRKNGWTAA